MFMLVFINVLLYFLESIYINKLIQKFKRYIINDKLLTNYPSNKQCLRFNLIL
jgi:hypothetical protein